MYVVFAKVQVIQNADYVNFGAQFSVWKHFRLKAKKQVRVLINMI